MDGSGWNMDDGGESFLKSKEVPKQGRDMEGALIYTGII
jgi:hypothetical protein